MAFRRGDQLLFWCAPSGERTGISKKLAGQYGPYAVGVKKYLYMLEDLPSQNANMQKHDLEDNRALSFATGPNAAIKD